MKNLIFSLSIGFSGLGVSAQGTDLLRSNERLFEAVKSNADVREIRYAIRIGADVDAIGWVAGWTPLMWAAYNGNSELVKALIMSGADVNKASKSGLTPLMHAANSGDTESVEALLLVGADPDAADREGWTAERIAERIDAKEVMNAFASHQHSIDYVGRQYMEVDSTTMVLLNQERNFPICGLDFPDEYHTDTRELLTSMVEDRISNGINIESVKACRLVDLLHDVDVTEVRKVLTVSQS